jgi:O-antigen ligase
MKSFRIPLVGFVVSTAFVAIALLMGARSYWAWALGIPGGYVGFLICRRLGWVPS